MKNFQRITHDKSFPFPPRTEVTVQCSSPSTRAQGSTLAWRRRGVRERAFGWVAIDKGYPTRRTRPLDERGKSKSVVEGCEQKQKRIKWTWENWTVRGRANQYFSRKKRRKKRKKNNQANNRKTESEKPRQDDWLWSSGWSSWTQGLFSDFSPPEAYLLGEGGLDISFNGTQDISFSFFTQVVLVVA